MSGAVLGSMQKLALVVGACGVLSSPGVLASQTQVHTVDGPELLGGELEGAGISGGHHSNRRDSGSDYRQGRRAFRRGERGWSNQLNNYHSGE